MDKSLTPVFIFWFVVVFPLAAAYALEKVLAWLDGPEPRLGCPDPASQDIHNESQHDAVISTAVNLRPYKRGDLC